MLRPFILAVIFACASGFTCPSVPGIRPAARALRPRARGGLLLATGSLGEGPEDGQKAPSSSSAQLDQVPPSSKFGPADAALLKAMAEEEAKAGNSTGAEDIMSYVSFSDRLNDIAKRSSSRMTAATMAERSPSPDESSPSSSESTEDSEDAEEKEVAKSPWVVSNSRMSPQEDDIWFVPPKDEAPKETVFLTAKTLNSYEPGAVVTWNVKVNALGRSNVGNGVMYIGLTTLGVDTGSDWGSDDSNNAAYYLTSQGNLFNGAMLVSDSYNAQFKEGDLVSVRLDGDAVYFAINGKDVEASIKPITGSLRLSVCLTSAGDGITFIDETVIRASPERETKSMYTSSEPSSGTATLDRSPSSDTRSTSTLERSIDDESDAILGSILEEASVPADVWQEVKDDASGRVYWWNSKTQESTWEMPAELAGAQKTKSFIELDRGLEKAIEKTKETGEELYANSAGDRDSHQVVEKDEYGQPMLDRFVYVDEITCIGCTNCATIARSTFFMQNEFGRARAFRQGGDSNEIIEEAVATCPVDCIWYVSWDDLKILEKERKGQVINPAARLVGGNFIESTQVQTYYNNRGERTGGSQASINQGGGMRCNNCPGKGCKNCPLFGVGENPEFLKKKKQREARKAARLAAQSNPIAKGLGELEDAIFEAAGAGDSDESTWTETTETTE